MDNPGRTLTLAAQLAQHGFTQHGAVVGLLAALLAILAGVMKKWRAKARVKASWLPN